MWGCLWGFAQHVVAVVVLQPVVLWMCQELCKKSTCVDAASSAWAEEAGETNTSALCISSYPCECAVPRSPLIETHILGMCRTQKLIDRDAHLGNRW